MASWVVLGPTWAVLGPIWAVVEANLGGLGANLGGLGANLGGLGANLGSLGANLSGLRRSWRSSWAYVGWIRAVKVALDGLEISGNHCKLDQGRGYARSMTPVKD